MLRARISPASISFSLAAAAALAGVACGGGGDASTDPDASIPDTGTHPPDAKAPTSDAGKGKDSGGGAPDATSPTEASTPVTPTIPPDAGTTGPTGTSTGLLIRVTNLCPVTLWSQGTAQEGILTPDYAELVPGATQEYWGPQTWTAGRIYAYATPPDATGSSQGQNDKIEMNFGITNGVQSVNTDITYVDWLEYPSQVQVVGTGSDCTTVGCTLPYATILDDCPPSLLTGHECMSAGSYCLDPLNDKDPFCHALDSQIAACASEYTDCAGAAGSTTSDVYACAGSFFQQSTEYCAALNRGVLSQPGTGTPPSAFYVSSPFNAYAAWVHQICPGIYAFPYDDYGSSNQSSDHTCVGATQINITWCPKG
jgi:hypothetical protein